MDSLLPSLLLIITIVGLIGVHIYGYKKQRQILLITIVLDFVVGGLALLAWVDHSTFKAWMQEDAW